MAWDSEKSKGSDLPSDEWNEHVEDQKNHSSRHESGGSDVISVAVDQITSFASNVISSISGEDIEPNSVSAQSLHAEQGDIDLFRSRNHLYLPFDNRERFSNAGEQINGFEDIANDWSASHGSVSAETSDVYRGSQSARMQASGEMARITHDFSTNQDFSETGFSIALKRLTISGSSPNSPLRIRLADADFNWREYRVRIREGQADQWGRRDFGIESEDAGFDPTTVGTVALQTNSRDEIDILVDDLRMVDESGEKGKVIVTFDDVHDRDTVAAEIFGKYGVPIGLAVNMNFIGNDGKLTLSELNDLYNSPDVYLINHGRNHTNLFEDGLEDTYQDDVDGKELMLEEGFRDSTDLHVYKQGSFNAEYIDKLHAIQAMSFGTGASSYDALTPNKFSTPYYNLRTSFDDGTTEAVDAINDAAAYGQVAHIYAHTNNVTDSELETIAQEIDNADVVPISMMEYYANNGGRL